MEFELSSTMNGVYLTAAHHLQSRVSEPCGNDNRPRGFVRWDEKVSLPSRGTRGPQFIHELGVEVHDGSRRREADHAQG